MNKLPNPAAKNTSRQHHSSSVPEPVPDWTKARQDWGWVWPLHHYGLGVLFLLVGIYGTLLVIKLWRRPAKKSRNYFMCIALLICVFGGTRATVLILDPYTSHELVTLPQALGLIMFSIGYPCLTSGFFLINWSLIEVTKLQLLPTRVHQHKILVPILCAHFCVVISFDCSFSFFPSIQLLLLVCRSFFVGWGILLFGGFIFAGLRIQRQLKRNLLVFDGIRYRTSSWERRMGNLAGNKINSSKVVTISTKTSVVNRNEMHLAGTGKVMKIARRAAATGLLICFAQIYTIWEFYSFYNNDVRPKVWPWWIYQTSFRLIELFMVSQMLFIVRRPK